MKQLLLIIAAFFVSTLCFAEPENSDVNKDSSKLNELNAVWRQVQSVAPKQDANDIMMVYGGKDISLRPSLVPSTTVV